MRLVRPASVTDCGDIARILNREIECGFAHFGLEPLPHDSVVDDFQMRGRHVWTVAEEEGAVLGFARSSPWKNRGGYGDTCEIGIYVREESQGQGVGRLIYETFIPALAEAGFHTALAGIALPNSASARLHESFGFRHVGTFPEVGFKLGEWRSVGYWAKVFSAS